MVHLGRAESIEVIWKDRKRTIFGLPFSFTKYRLTGDRLLIERGFFNLSEAEVRLYRILDISLHRTIWQRLFGLGTIICVSTDQSLRNFKLVNIRSPKAVKERLSDLVEVERSRRCVSVRELMESGSDVEGDTGLM